jgi:CubicO group peptidase (beta-lactamase class C family)
MSDENPKSDASTRIVRRTAAMPLDRRTLIATAGLLPVAVSARAQTPLAAPHPKSDLDQRIRDLVPKLERTVTAGMADFDVPGAAVGILAGDRLVYSKGFGVRRKAGGGPVGPKTVFQIGSTTKAFLATLLALAVDRGKLKWDDRVIDLDPSFSLKDPYVTREFRVYDLLAQRSGLPPYANDVLAGLGFDADRLMHSLRFVEPITSFRTTFAYTNITHLFAGRIVARALGASDWPALAAREITGPLGMHDTSFSAEAIATAPDHAVGYRWTAAGSVEIPFDPSFPYLLGPAGDINATVEDCARWLRLQIGNGVFAGRRLVSAENLRVTRTPKVALTDVVTYAMGWIISSTPNGRAIWHNGGTYGFGAHIGFLPGKGVGLIVLTNEDNEGFPDAVGLWAYDRLLGNPETDHMHSALARAKAEEAEQEKVYKKPASSRPPPDLAAVAGDYASEELGPATLAPDGGRLLATLKETGAQLALEPFDGAVFTVRLLPQGRFARIVATQGDMPIGFADFVANPEGRLTRLRWTMRGQVHLLTKRRTGHTTEPEPGPPKRVVK